MFGPNQVGELIIGNSAATDATVQAFVTTAADKSIRVYSEDGTAAAAGVPFYVVQKTAGDAAKGLNYEFSDVVDPRNVEKVTVKAYAAEVQKAVSVSGFATAGSIVANTTYEVEIRLYNDGGSLSPENFAIIQGFYVTGDSVAAETSSTIRDGVLASLNKNLIKRGNFEFVTAAVSTTGFTITGKAQNVVAGKIIGKQIEFDVLAKSYPNAYDVTKITQNTGYITATVTATANPGSGTAKSAINYEWFVKGYKYEAYRQTGYPADFNTPYYASAAGVYNTIQIKYFEQRKETSVERQYKVLTIMVDKVTDTLANNANTNTILTSIRTAVSTYATVPANLAVV